MYDGSLVHAKSNFYCIINIIVYSIISMHLIANGDYQFISISKDGAGKTFSIDATEVTAC